MGIAQLVRAPDCGSGGHRFEADYPPHLFLLYSILGCSQVGKAPDFDSGIRRFESCQPSHLYDPLAQSAEHLTFNQGVPRSNRGWVTNTSYVRTQYGFGCKHSQSENAFFIFIKRRFEKCRVNSQAGWRIATPPFLYPRAKTFGQGK